MDPAQMQFVYQPSEIVCVVHGGISGQGLINIRLVVSAAVCNHVILCAERSELRIPKRPVAQRTMNEYNGFPLSKLHVVKLNPVANLHLLNCWYCTSRLRDSRRVPRRCPCNRAYQQGERLQLPQSHRASPMFEQFCTTNLFRTFFREPMCAKTGSLLLTSLPRHFRRIANSRCDTPANTVSFICCNPGKSDFRAAHPFGPTDNRHTRLSATSFIFLRYAICASFPASVVTNGPATCRYSATRPTLTPSLPCSSAIAIIKLYCGPDIPIRLPRYRRTSCTRSATVKKL